MIILFVFYLFLSTSESTLNIPDQIFSFEYNPVVRPQRGTDPSSVRPLGLGSIVMGGRFLTLRIVLDEFSEPVDIYFGVYAPVFSPEVYLFNSENRFVPITDGLVPWKMYENEPIQEVIADVPLSGVPPGDYFFYLGVTPAGRTDAYYLWQTHLQVPERDLVGEVMIGPDGGGIKVESVESAYRGTEIEIPEGALSYLTDIRLYEFTTPAGLRVLHMAPEGITLQKSAVVRIPYRDIFPFTDRVVVMALEESEGGWIELPTVVDTASGVAEANIVEFTQLRVAESRMNFEAYPLRNDRNNKLSASISLKRSFEEITPGVTGAPLDGYPSLREWIEAEPEAVRLLYRVQLKEIGDGGEDRTIGERLFAYGLRSSTADRYLVVVEDDNGEVFESKREMPIEEAISEGWLSGTPLLFQFDVTGENEKEYYLVIRTYFVKQSEMWDLLSGDPEGYYPMLYYRTEPVSFSGIEKQSTPDSNLNGIRDEYEPPELYNPGVSPLKGDTHTVYTFYVGYFDPNGDPPSEAKLYIGSHAYEMTLGIGTPSDGVYFANTTLSEGRHQYFVVFEDSGIGGVVSEGWLEGPDVSGFVDNSVPSILLGGASPLYGDESTPFLFFADFYDSDGDAPSKAQVNIRGGRYSMTLQSGTVSDGRYAYQRHLGSGCYYYSFFFKDQKGAGVELPSLGSFYGPAVAETPEGFSPSLPKATCPINHNPELREGGVEPSSGDTCTEFTFYVHYYDEDGDPASQRVVYVSGRPYYMKLVSGRASDGRYEVTTRIPYGSHTFYFSFTDGRGGEARYPLLDDLEGPEVEWAGGFSPGLKCP